MLYGNFDIIFDDIRGMFERFATPYALCGLLYLVTMLIGCRLVLAIRCCDRFTSSGATDAASLRNGTTAFYLSVGPQQIGVVTGPTPDGPFSDPLGKPLIPIGMVPTYSRDPTVLMDDDGTAYGNFDIIIILGGFFLDHFPRSFKVYNTSHAPRAAIYLVPMLIVC